MSRGVRVLLIKAYFPPGDFIRATQSEAKTIIRQSDWLKLAGEKIRREQVGSIPTFFSQNKRLPGRAEE